LRDITERKRAEERLRRETARAEALARLAARLNSQLDLDTVLNLLCEETAHALGVPATSVLLYRPERQEFVPTATYGLPPEALDQFRPMPRTLYDEFARRVGPLIVVPDVQAVPDLVNMELLARYGVRTAVVASLSRGGELVGSLNIHTMHGPRTFDEWELALLKALADQAVQAIINARLFAQVHASQEQLRNLAEYLQAAREEERTRIAREIHDEFGQTLTALKMDLAWLSKQLPRNKPRLMDKTRAMLSLLDSTIQLVRRVATELRPGLLDDLGLVAAMEWQAQEFTEHTKIECELHLGEEPVAFEQDLNTAIFRIFQEALTNVARHAGATQVRIDAQHKPDEWVLIIQDNGRGIVDNQIADPHSLGLMGMRERARAWGGDVTLEGIPGQGTTVTVHIPRAQTKEAPG
jgi:signal transduction histidine kinase